MFNWIKIAAIKLTDVINKVIMPWDKFTRPMILQGAPQKLSEKANAFETDYLARFFDPATSFFQYMIPFNPGDQSLWHGIASSMYAFRDNVFHDKKMLAACINGLVAHQPNGYLMRGKVGDKVEWATSNDQASGHLAGLYFTNQRDLAKQWASKIIDHKYCMTEPDGTVTKFGKLEDGILTDPLRLSLLLAILKFAGYGDHYRKLLKKYDGLVQFPKVYLGTLGKTYDTHRAAIHLSILNDLDPTVDYYKKGLERMRDDATKDGNVWVMMLIARAGIQVDVDIIKKVLYEFEVAQRLQGNIERINSKDAAKWESYGIKMKKWNGEMCATQPLPRWTCGSQDFYWQRSLRSVDNWAGNTTAGVWHSGLDFLLCYYLGRTLGIISEND